MQSLKVLDRAMLDSLRERQSPGDPDIIGELLRMFTADSAVCRAAAEHAVRVRDAAALAVAAHRLRGSARLLGLQRLQRAAEELERVANVGGPSEWTARMLRVSEALAEAQGALKQVTLRSR
jgi:HPt (histidine-containing phosphotransfer) domain-containing protein